MAEHKAALLHYAAHPYVETVNGAGVLTGARRETDPLCYGTLSNDAKYSSNKRWTKM